MRLIDRARVSLSWPMFGLSAAVGVSFVVMA
jgi:hypothetical protein